MITLNKLRRMLRGGVSPADLTRETLRRAALKYRQSVERTRDRDLAAYTLSGAFRDLSADQLLDHFRKRRMPTFFPGLGPRDQSQYGVEGETDETLRSSAADIVHRNTWKLLGLAPRDFGAGVGWRTDPLSGFEWPLTFHADIKPQYGQGSDLRLLWELNRLGHLFTVARGYSTSSDTSFIDYFFAQIEDWQAQNPAGQGPNWMCAMEVAIRAINIIGSFEIFRQAEALTDSRLNSMLSFFESHGRYIRANLEFSYVSTSNHYLSDVVGLFWLGIMMPELAAAESWKELGLREMLNEMDKQVLPDGADFESSTGYHRYATELFLYSFILADRNGIKIPAEYIEKLRGMLRFIRSYVRPDGNAPLIGDSDSGRILPFGERRANEHSYLLPIGAVFLGDPELKSEFGVLPAELRGLLGSEGVRRWGELTGQSSNISANFPDAGLCIMRRENDYALLNYSGIGVHGRGSHAHNDALSLEISACGTAFIVDPGSYIYTADLKARHEFRSTDYHSTVTVDDLEQNTINPDLPFIIGGEAKPRLLSCDIGSDVEHVSAEHSGYLKAGVTHHRKLGFYREAKFWIIEDTFLGSGTHTLKFNFHFAPGLMIDNGPNGLLARSPSTGTTLALIPYFEFEAKLALLSSYSSNDYGSRAPSTTARWTTEGAALPLSAQWLIVPVCPNESVAERTKTAGRISERLIS